MSKAKLCPLAFLSGSFTDSSLRWSTPEKEAYEIIAFVTRLDYILQRPEGFMMFTYHENFVFMLKPIQINPKTAKHVVNNVER